MSNARTMRPYWPIGGFRAPAGGGDGGADGARLRRRLFDQLVLLVVSPVPVLFVVLVPLAIAARCQAQLATDCHRHSTMCVCFESSHRSRTRSPDIVRRW
jgi:hypothetical protein